MIPLRPQKQAIEKLFAHKVDFDLIENRLKNLLIEQEYYLVSRSQKDFTYSNPQQFDGKTRISEKLLFVGYGGLNNRLLIFKKPRGYTETFSFIDVATKTVTIQPTRVMKKLKIF